MKTAELIGPALDWAVAKLEGEAESAVIKGYVTGKGNPCGRYAPSTDWAQGGPIIEREWISVYQVGNFIWKADIAGLHNSGPSPTPLIAAMRCYCCAKLGDEIEIPEELQQCQPPNL